MLSSVRCTIVGDSPHPLKKQKFSLLRSVRLAVCKNKFHHSLRLDLLIPLKPIVSLWNEQVLL